MSISSYRVREPISETQRLAIQASVGWAKQARFLLSHGLPTSGRLLEVGCGPGFITQLLRHLVPECRITAVDRDAMMVQRAGTLLKSADTTELAQASVLALPFAAGSFDAVLVRLVLQHLIDPDRALAEIHRVLRTGGRLLVMDVDDAVDVATDPEVPHGDALRRGLASLQMSRGGNRSIGRYLPCLLREAGFVDLDLDLVALHSDLVGTRPLLEVIGVAQHLLPQVDESIVSPRQKTEVSTFFDRVARDDQHLTVLLALLLVSGTVG
jgi:SAM-dependent methyltransferase